MGKFQYDLITIGGGAAGLTASTFAGQAGAKSLLIEKEKKLGGDCLHFGCVPSKSLIKSGYAYNVMRQSEKYGLPKVNMPPVDFIKVRDRIRVIIDTIQRHDEPEYLQQKYNVETAFGCPRFLDPHTVTVNGQTYTSRYFVLATGSRPYIPDIEGLKDVPYITNMEIFALDRLPGSMAVIGGGPIGLEMAQAMNRLGAKTTVIQHADQILPREDQDVSKLVEERLTDEGVKIFVKSEVVKTELAGNVVRLTVKNSQTPHHLEAEMVLVAAGRRPNIEGLDLAKAGVHCNTRGIGVNQRLQTSAKNIYACGDVNGSLLFTHVASYEAVVAIHNAILKIPKKADYTNVPWCTYLDPEVASIGYNEKRASQAGVDYRVQIDHFKENDRALAESETEGFIKILINKKGRAIGVQIVGFHAGDLIHEWVPVLNGKAKLSTISDSIHVYPTMAEISKNSSVNYVVSTIPPWTKKITKFVFGYQGKV